MVNLLTEIFPSVAENTLNEYASNSLDINEAVNDIADFMKDNAEQIPNISENKKKRLIIDEENVLQDCLSYYKRQDFDAKLALRIVFDGQTAVDAGGPLRHFFTLVSKEMSQNFFEGNQTNLVPKIDANTCLSEILCWVRSSHTTLHMVVMVFLIFQHLIFIIFAAAVLKMLHYMLHWIK